MTRMDSNKDIIFKDLSYEIMAAAYEVHNTLGSGFLEKVYENALLIELQTRGLNVTAQKELDVFYRNQRVGLYVADIVVNNEVVLELKATEFLQKAHEAQLLNYLKCTGCRLGILINFGKERVESKRFVL